MKKLNVLASTGVVLGAITLTAAIGVNAQYVLAVPDKPGGSSQSGSGQGGPGGQGGSQGGGQSSSSSTEHTGATTFTSDTSEDGKTYTSSTGSENAILQTGGTVSLTNPTIEKTGDSSDENADFYGTNAGVFVSSGTLNITGGTVTTNGTHANGVFAYDSGVINISDTTIKTSKSTSGGIMVTGGGTLNASNLTIETQEGSSAAIRSDRGGGTMNVDGGTYTTNGVGSPAIYSTANINVANAALVSNVSEGCVIEGLNSITLNNTTVMNSNTKLNGNSETYKNIFIYQSMSGDAEEGTGTFTAKNTTFTESHGDQFFITNTTAVINLENNKFVNNTDASDYDAIFLRATTGKWGNSGSNGGEVTLNATDQNIKGDFYADSISTLAINLTSGSYLLGAVNSENDAKSVSVSVDDDSVWVLTSDSYVTSFSGTASKTVYGNGHKLYVNGTEVETNSGTIPEMDESDDGADADVTASTDELASTVESNDTTDSEAEETESNSMMLLFAILGGLAAAVVLAVVVAAIVSKKKKGPKFDAPSAPLNDNTPENPTPGEGLNG